MSRWVVFWSFITGVLEEAKFFGISSVLEQLEEMVKVLVGKFYACFLGRKMNPSLKKCARIEIQ